jgi:hypothetical protein
MTKGDYLGRWQQGEILPLSVTTTTAAGAAEDPQAEPVATVYRDGASLTRVVQATLAAHDRGAAVGRFRLPFFLGAEFSTAGRYLVVIRWVTDGGVPRVRTGTFYLLPGGSADGAVIGMAFVSRPDANHLVMQTDSGRILRGRNPRAP